VHGWIEPFYEEAGAAAIEPGQIWCDQPVQLPPRHALKIDRVNPKDDSKVDFTLSARTPDTFEHPPLHSLGLGAGEGAVLARTARDRPVVVLGGTTATELDPSGPRDAGTVIVVPIFGAERYDEPTRRRIAAYAYTNAFYLPAHERLGESFARLDQAQPVLRAQLVEHQGLRLSSDALDALVEWFVAFSTGRQPEDSLILEYRREMLAGS
jgi:hypothetical protein